MSEAGSPRLLIHEGAAALALEGVVPADHFLEPSPMTVKVGATSLRAKADPGSEQNDQLLFGEGFDVLLTERGWGFGQARRDGYVGWVRVADLRSGSPAPTHRVAALGSVALAAPDIRAPASLGLALNALVQVEASQGRFARVEGAGWMAASHLAPMGLFEADPAAVAERHVGIPYLWGGRDRTGIDCSGLVQQALFACGRGCPRDSDRQAMLGVAVEAGDLHRGDLVCWTGHIGIMADERRLVHACGRQMAVVIEPLADAMASREATAGPPIGYRRLAGL